MSKDNRALGTSMFVTSMLISGPSVVAIKYILEDFDPILVGAIRTGVMGILITLGLVITKKWTKIPIRKLMPTTIMFALNMISLTLALEYTDAIILSFATLLAPIFVYLGAVIYLHEARSNKALFGALISLFGGLLLTASPLFGGVDEVAIDNFVGNVLAIVTGVGYAGIILLSKKVQQEYDSVNILASRFVVASAILFTTSVIVGESIPESVSLGSILGFAYFILIGGVLTNILLFKGLDYIRAEDSASLTYLEPLAGATAAMLVLGDNLDRTGVLGASIIVLGILLAHPVHVHVWHHYHAPHKPSILERIKHFLENPLKDIMRLR